ncbi:aspartate/glutamate racemase family protein [Ramlibacter sp. AN1133]|uniref:aspartate/glutamate racemase family protein n=1 Tax=Ramlibacter sp. AN1133 TaxID=3133429 RepID=UPI0030BBA032
MSVAPRIALIHATPLAMEPIQAAFQRQWPQVRTLNLLDDSLSHDRAQAGRLTDELVRRFEELARYAQHAGASGILFTCSAFGPAIEAAGRATGLPTLKPNEAMFEQALALARGSRPLHLGLVATFQASLPSMTEELQDMARRRGIAIDLRTVFVPEAMDDLAQGRPADHHRKIAQAARALAHCDAVMLAQFSMAAALPIVQAELPCPLFSSPDCAVRALMQRMSNAR